MGFTQNRMGISGDSFTHGACVKPGEDIGGQIRLITGENTLNLGMAGNAPLIMLGALKEYVEFREPKKVLWLYYEGNDMDELKQEKSSTLLRSYLQPGFSQNLIVEFWHRGFNCGKMLIVEGSVWKILIVD